jgi:hypothetical protein
MPLHLITVNDIAANKRKAIFGNATENNAGIIPESGN